MSETKNKLKTVRCVLKGYGRNLKLPLPQLGLEQLKQKDKKQKTKQNKKSMYYNWL